MPETPDERDDADDTDEPVVACTLTEAEVEQRREDASEDLIPRFEGLTELEDGYRLHFAGGADTLAAVARFVGKEAECCSFADFAIEYERPHDAVGLRFSGPEGTKALLREGFADAFDDVTMPS